MPVRRTIIRSRHMMRSIAKATVRLPIITYMGHMGHTGLTVPSADKLIC